MEIALLQYRLQVSPQYLPATILRAAARFDSEVAHCSKESRAPFDSKTHRARRTTFRRPTPSWSRRYSTLTITSHLPVRGRSLQSLLRSSNWHVDSLGRSRQPLSVGRHHRDWVRVRADLFRSELINVGVLRGARTRASRVGTHAHACLTQAECRPGTQRSADRASEMPPRSRRHKDQREKSCEASEDSIQNDTDRA
jgi:hypothetical protein